MNEVLQQYIFAHIDKPHETLISQTMLRQEIIRIARARAKACFI